MSKIVFLNEPNTIYDGTFSQIGKNQVRLIFTDAIPSEDVLTSGFNLVNEHNGRPQTRREDYTYIYRTYIDNPNMVELCNDNTSWISPIPIVKFVIDVGGVLNGETTQTVNTYEELVIPRITLESGYEFVEWTPEIPTEGKIEENVTFRASIIDNNIYFYANEGGFLDGETKQTVNDYSELVIPTPVADDNYIFVEWTPEIPTEGKIDSANTTFYAIFSDNTSDRLNSLESDLTDTQMGLIENYDLATTTAEEVTDIQLALVEIYDMIMGGN